MTPRLFVVSAFLFGTIFIAIVPPFQVADEFNHFYRAWQVSDGIFVGVRTADNRLGGDLPTSVVKIAEPFRSLPFQPNNRIKSSTIFDNLLTPLEAEKSQFADFTNTAVYAPTAYLPQSLAILVGKFLKIGPLSIFYFARFFTLIFWLSMIYAALKIIPIKNNLFTALALLPSSLFINASASGDVVTNASSFLLIALFLKLILEKKSDNSRQTLTFFSLVSVLSIVISLNKPAYFPLIFLIFLIKKEHVNGLKNKLMVAATLIAANAVAVVLWAKKIQPLYIKYEDYHPVFRIGQQLNEQVDPAAQIAFSLNNPLIFGKIAIFSLLKTFPSTLVHYVGKFGWEKNYLPLPIIAILVLLILIQACFEEKSPISAANFPVPNPQKGPLSIKAKFGFLGVACLMTFSFAAAMYAIWCPVGSPFIENLGGKYFIPIYPLFFLALPRFDGSKSRVLGYLAQPKVLYGALYLSLLWSIVQVILRYYTW